MRFRFSLVQYFLLLICLYVVSEPEISNCENKGGIKVSYKTIIKPKWKTEAEKAEIMNYDWTYKLTRPNGSEIDIQNWLEHMSKDTYQLTIPAYSLLPSNPKKYTVTIRCKRKPTVKTGPPSLLTNGFKECELVVAQYFPIIIISGGLFEIEASPNDDLFLNGEESFDPNFNPKRYDTLIYNWTCYQAPKTPFCDTKETVSKDKNLTIPGEYVHPGQTIYVDLEIKLNYIKHTEKRKRIKVFVKIMAAVIKLDCRKNCIPQTHFPKLTEETLFGVSCLQHCKGVKNEDFVWEVTSATPNKTFVYDYSKGRFGTKGRMFQIPPNHVTKGFYIVSVKLKALSGIKAYSSHKILYGILPPKIEDCKMIPNDGKTLVTDFMFTCTQTPADETNLYELYSKDKNNPNHEELIIEGYYPEIMETPFKLPTSNDRDFIVKAKGADTPKIELPIQVNVLSSLAGEPPEKVIEVLGTLYHGSTPEDSFLNLITSKIPNDRQKGYKNIKTLTDELKEVKVENENLKNFVNDLKSKVANDILKAPITSIHEVITLSDSLATIQSVNEVEESDPLLFKLTSTVCKKLADSALNVVQKEQYPLDEQDDAKKVAGSIAKCVASNSNPNPTVTAPIILNLTTEAPIFDGPLLTEHYENYIDFDENYYKNLEYLKESSFNQINVSATIAKLTALTTAIGEGEIKTFGKQSETLVIKNFGDELFKTSIKVNGLLLLNSQDFENDTHTYDILVTIFEQDILWWNPDSVLVVTNIIVCEFWHSTCKDRVTSFDDPVDIFLDVKQDMNVVANSTKYLIKVLQDHSNMTNLTLNYEIKVHRILLPATRNLFINFPKLNTSDVLQVVLTKNKFPAIEDFDHSTTISTDTDNFLTLQNRDDYHIIAYIGILVNKNFAVAGKTVPYELSIISRLCLKWVPLNSTWVPTCRPGNLGNDSVVHCECTHFSTIAGYIQELPSTTQEVARAELRLELSCSLIIFTTLTVTLGIFYFLLVVLIISRKKETVYYLGDNEANNLFAYLVIVKTGSWCGAGTTSNVTIRLIGEKKISQPHVLNYPDSSLRFLQQFGKDQFLLTTKNHLGDLKEIELWNDGVGPSASWYCKDITVFDMQEKTEWYFDIRKRLSIVKNSSYLIVKPTVVLPQELGRSKTKSEIKIPKKTVSKTSMFFQILQGRLHFSKIFTKFSFFNFFCRMFVCPAFPFQSSSKPRVTKTFFEKFTRLCSALKKTFSFPMTYHTWSFWQQEKNFPHATKLGVMLSTILTTYVVVLTVLGLPVLKLRDGLDQYDLATINLVKVGFTAFGSSFITFLLHFVIAWSFRLRFTLAQHKQSLKVPKRCNLTCWIIIFIFILVSTTILVVFGFWVPFNNSMVWLLTSLLALTFGVVIHESLFLFIQHNLFIFRPFEDVSVKFYSICRSIEHQRYLLYREFGEHLLRPYFEHLYKPLEKNQLKKMFLLLTRRLRVISDFEDLIMFGVYIVILYVVILADKDSRIILGKTNMLTMLQGVHTRSRHFDDCSTMEDFYFYINETLIPTMQPTHWYKKYVISSPAIMVDMVNKFLGVARLRQHRMLSDICHIAEPMSFLNVSCNPEFALTLAETKSFGHKWEKYSPYVKFDRMSSIWHYTSQMKTQTFPVFGEVAIYSGGGYIAYLGRTLYNSYMNFRKLFQHVWVNEKTRAVFIEFLTYNVDYNIFSAVTLKFEQSASGLVFNNIRVNTERMLLGQSEMRGISAAFFLFFTIWVGMLFLKQSLGVIKNIKQFYKDFWTMVDIIIIFTSLVAIVCIFIRTHIVGEYLHRLEEIKNNEFQSYAHLFYIQEFLTVIGAFLVCIATVRLWKFLRFAKLFLVLERTLALSALPLSSTLIVLVVVLLSSSLAIVRAIGKEFQRLSSIIKAIHLLLMMDVSAYRMKLKELVPYKVAMFYVIIFTWCLKITVILIITNIVSAYSEAQLEFSIEKDEYTIKHYVLEKLNYIPKYMKYKYGRLCGGESEKNKVTPKPDKFLYSGSFSLPTFKMNLMKLITYRLIKNRKKIKHGLSNSDVLLMIGVCEFYLSKRNKDDVEVFFKGRERGKVKMVHESNIEKVANFVNLMLKDNKSASFASVVFDDGIEACCVEIRNELKCLKRCELNLKLLVLRMTEIEVAFRGLV